MRIKAEETIAIVVDYQAKLMPVILDNDVIVKNSKILIEGLKELDIPMFVSQQYTKGLGETIPEIAESLGKFQHYEKKSFSVWQTEEIQNAIKETNRKNVIICGAEAHICVLQTLVDLIAEGYNVFLVEDCIGSRKKNDKKFACKRAIIEGAFLTTYEAVLYELTGGASNEHFKAISKLTK